MPILHLISPKCDYFIQDQYLPIFADLPIKSLAIRMLPSLYGLLNYICHQFPDNAPQTMRNMEATSKQTVPSSPDQLNIQFVKTKYIQYLLIMSIVEKQPFQAKAFQLVKIATKNRVGRVENINDETNITPFNMILQPYAISSKEFEKLKKLSYLWQKLTHLASYDSQLIIKTFDKIEKDPMVGPMLKIYKQTIHRKKQTTEGLDHKKEQIQSKGLFKSKIELFRTDFFITEDEADNIKLIQYNNMSVSMAGMSQQFQKSVKELWGASKNIIENNSNQTYARGLIQFYTKANLSGIILAVVQSNETNVIDQNLLFRQVQNNLNIQIERVTLQKFNDCIHIDQKGDLYYKQNKKVAIVYYRSGYSTKQKIQWEGIKKANLSNAVNLPSVCAFLIGTKKMQAELSKKQVMMRFLKKQEADLLFTSVIDTWEFDKESDKQEALKMMQKEGINNFVLKPNEEGGKNNFFGQDALDKIKSLSESELPHYILTRKIFPRIQNSVFIRIGKQVQQTKLQYCQIQNQVSIYGCICTQCVSKCARNCCGGYLVRSKPKQVNEGGLISGFGALSALEIKDEE